MTSNILTAVKIKVLLIEYCLMEYTVAKGDFEVRISVRSLELSFSESCPPKRKKVQIIHMWIVECGLGLFL